MSRTRSTYAWILTLGGAVALGLLISARCARDPGGSARATIDLSRGGAQAAAQHAAAVAQAARRRVASGDSAPGAVIGAAADEVDARGEPASAGGPAASARAAALDRRLRAAMTVMTVPGPAGHAAGGPSAPTPRWGALSSEAAVARRVALNTWTATAQRQLDSCVGRDAAARERVALEVVFAPGTPPASAPTLSPVVISLPADALRRLWRDTDPDALQRCLDQLRGLALGVPSTAAAPAPPSAESVVVRL